MKKTLRLLKKLSPKRKKSLEIKLVERQHNRKRHERNLLHLYRAVAEFGLAMTGEQESFLGKLSGNALGIIDNKVRHSVTNKKDRQYALEGCIEYYQKAIAGEQPLRAQKVNLITVYLDNYLARRRELENK